MFEAARQARIQYTVLEQMLGTRPKGQLYITYPFLLPPETGGDNSDFVHKVARRVARMVRRRLKFKAVAVKYLSHAGDQVTKINVSLI